MTPADPVSEWTRWKQPARSKRPMLPGELRDARKRLGMTQAQLAAALKLQGADRTRTVRSWEKGERPITGPVEVAVELMLERAGLLAADR